MSQIADVTSGEESVVKALFDHLPVSNFRELALDSLRTYLTRAPTAGWFDVQTLMGDLVRPALLEMSKSGSESPMQPVRIQQVFTLCQSRPWMDPVVSCLSWLVRAGYAVPLAVNYRRAVNEWPGDQLYPERYGFTAAGRRYILSRDEFALGPAFLHRLQESCPGIPDAVLESLQDARECLDHCLVRPAVALLGLAYEIAIEHVVDALLTGNMLTSVPQAKAGKRIDAVKGVLKKVLTNPEAAFDAYDFADALRHRRNHAMHPSHRATNDPIEVEEYLVSAVRHLPALWAPAVPP